MRNSIFLIMLLFLYGLIGFHFVYASEWEYEDLDGFEWAEEAIYYFKNQNGMLTEPVTKFEPDHSVTRSEFAFQLARYFKDSSSYYCDFKDVSPEEWYYKEIGIAQKYQIVQGNGEGYFYPEKELSRQDAAVMLVNLLKAKGIQLPDGNNTIAYDDIDLIDSYAVESINILRKLKIMGGEGNKFEPNKTINRAEACVMLYQTLNCFPL